MSKDSFDLEEPNMEDDEPLNPVISGNFKSVL